MCVSISQVARFRIQSLGSSCCERVHGWFKSNSNPRLLDVRASTVDDRNRWIRRNASTTTQGGTSTSSRSKNKPSSVLGATVPLTKRIKDAVSKTKIQQPFGNLQLQISQEKNLSELLTYVVFDLETTGLSRSEARIIEIAAQDLKGGEDATFQSLINPAMTITNTCFHGISNEMVRRPEVPRMEELIPAFLSYVKRRQKPGGYVVMVAHNGKTFDFPFLMNEFSRHSHEIPHNWLLLDSLPIARENMKSHAESQGLKVQPKASLQALGEYYNLERDGEAHRALSDVILLSKVFGRLTNDLELSDPDLVLRSHTVSDLTTAAAAAAAKNKKT